MASPHQEKIGSLTDISPDIMGILAKDEVDIYPNLYEFVAESGKACRAEFDVVTFSDVGLPKTAPDAHGPASSEDRPEAGGSPRTAELVIIENIDEGQIRRLLDRVADAHRSSFLKFLDDYLYNHPTYNFDDAQENIAAPPSTLAAQQHVAFFYSRAREFQEAFDLSYEVVQASSKDREAGVWRNKRTYGPMNPVPRIDSNGEVTRFRPLAVARTHIAAWFDAESNKPWTLGIILVDRAATFSHIPQQLKPSYFNIAGRKYRGVESTRTLLSRCMQQNPNLNRPGIPAPFVVLQDAYRLMAFEWSRMDSFVTRDLNFIEWILQGGNAQPPGDDGDAHGPGTYKMALRSLFYLRRRLNRYRHLVREQLASCRQGGRPSWKLTVRDEEAEEAQVLADRVAKELAGDFAHVEMLMAQSYDRLEQSIRTIASETTLREAERTNQQNRILLVLAVAGTFFLPVSAVAAVFSMTGDWAPEQANFPMFWAVCISITIVLILMLVVIIRWNSIKRSVKAMRQRGRGGYVSMV